MAGAACAADAPNPIAITPARTWPAALIDMRSLHVESFVNDTTLIDAGWLHASASIRFAERLARGDARLQTVVVPAVSPAQNQRGCQACSAIRTSSGCM